MLANQKRRFRQTCCMAVCLFMVGCVYDFYQQRTEMVKAHVEAFNMYLKADRSALCRLTGCSEKELLYPLNLIL